MTSMELHVPGRRFYDFNEIRKEIQFESLYSESDDISFMANMNPAKKLKQDPVNMVSTDEPLFQMPIFEESWDASSVDAFMNADATQDGGNEVDLWSFSDLPAILDGSF
ncbi:hypothetical protein Hanom_Chr05g00443441 [Helianthus anomalus]